MYNVKINRLIKILKWQEIGEEKTYELMQLIPKQSRNIIETRWGLIGDTKGCHSYKILGKKLNLENPRYEYDLAIEDLKNAEYVLYLFNDENLDYKTKVALGKLSLAIFKEQCKENFVNAKVLLNYINELVPRDKIILKKEFFENKSIMEIAILMELPEYKVKALRNRSIFKFRKRISSLT